MILSFKDRGSEDVFDGSKSKEAGKICPSNLWPVARRKLDQINAAVSLNDLKVPPGNRLEALKGDRNSQYSIRINDRYRICFKWINNNALEVEIVDYH
jgi:proteic killer suppression protein